MSNIYFDDKKELVVWGFIFIILGLITSSLFSIDEEFGVWGVISIMLWIGLGKYGPKFILRVIDNNTSLNPQYQLTFHDRYILFKYKVSKTISKVFSRKKI
jgi:hypothetical protein